MRGIDEPAKIIRASIQMRGGEQIDTVVPPSEAAFELRDGH